MHPPVGAHVTTIRIRHAPGIDHRVVERGVENRALVIGSTLHREAGFTKRPVPAVPSFPAHAIEVPVVDLRLQVTPRAFNIHERDAYLEQHAAGLPVSEFGVEPDMVTLVLPAVPDQRGGCPDPLPVSLLIREAFLAVNAREIGAPDDGLPEGRAEASVEMQGVAHAPAAMAPAAPGGITGDPALKRTVVDHADELPGGRAPDAMGEIKLHPVGRITLPGEREPEHTRTGRGREFAADVVVIEGDGIVTRFHHLRPVPETTAVAAAGNLFPARHHVERTARRRDEEVAEIPVPAHAAHVREAEPLDRGVVMGVARGLVARRVGVRAQLHHTEGAAGSGKGFPQIAVRATGVRADQRIDPGGGRPAAGHRSLHRARGWEQQRSDE